MDRLRRQLTTIPSACPPCIFCGTAETTDITPPNSPTTERVYQCALCGRRFVVRFAPVSTTRGHGGIVLQEEPTGERFEGAKSWRLHLLEEHPKQVAEQQKKVAKSSEEPGPNMHPDATRTGSNITNRLPRLAIAP